MAAHDTIELYRFTPLVPSGEPSRCVIATTQFPSSDIERVKSVAEEFFRLGWLPVPEGEPPHGFRVLDEDGAEVHRWDWCKELLIKQSRAYEARRQKREDSE